MGTSVGNRTLVVMGISQGLQKRLSNLFSKGKKKRGRYLKKRRRAEQRDGVGDDARRRHQKKGGESSSMIRFIRTPGNRQKRKELQEGKESLRGGSTQ